MVADKQAQILSTLLANKGQIRTVKIKRPLKLKKGCESDYPIYKETIQQARCGISYENIKAVSEGRDNGELPAKNMGMKGKSWELYPYLLRNDGGELLFRFYRVNSMMGVKTKFFLGEKEVDKPEIASMVYASDLNTKVRPSLSNVFDVKIKSIVEVK